MRCRGQNDARLSPTSDGFERVSINGPSCDDCVSLVVCTSNVYALVSLDEAVTAGDAPRVPHGDAMKSSLPPVFLLSLVFPLSPVFPLLPPASHLRLVNFDCCLTASQSTCPGPLTQ